MTIVYGGCIEPEGMEIDDVRDVATCPNCDGEAVRWFVEDASSGSVNAYFGLRCDGCGHAEGSHPSDETSGWTEDFAYDVDLALEPGIAAAQAASATHAPV